MVELIVVLLLIAFNGFFALSEMSVVTARKARLKQMAATERSAGKALELAEHPERFLSTVQVGITLIGILTGSFGGEAWGRAIGGQLLEWFPAMSAGMPLFDGSYANGIGMVLAIGLITYLSIVLGELLPKRLALLAPERVASVVALPMIAVSNAATPAVWLLSASTRSLLRMLRLDKTEASRVTEEELRMLVTESHEQGVIDADERKMVNRVLSLGDRTAESLMTPRTRIAWLDAAGDLQENLETMRDAAYSRFPVYRGGDQDVLGILEVKTLLRSLGDNGQPDLFGHLREPLFVSESTHALKLLEIFREEQQSLALVVDEYGDVSGLVTVNDLMGAVIGRLQSTEAEEGHATVIEREDGSLLVDGALPIEDLREVLGGGRLPDEDEHDFHTAAGMVIAHFGRIPHVGEWFVWSEWRIEVIDLDGPRIDKLLLQRQTEPEPSIDDPSA